MNNGERESPIEYLKKLQDDGRRIVYIPNPGNYGDGLICAATLQLFSKSNIDYLAYSINFKYDSSHVYVYGGGGNFNELYSSAKKVLSELSSYRAEVVFLPHSCYGVDNEIKNYPGSLRIYARELQTLKYLESVKSSNLRFKIYDDLAFYLDTTDPLFYNYQVFKELYSHVKHEQGVLKAFRTDSEGRFTKSYALEPGNIDLSNAWPKVPNNMPKGFDLYWLDAVKLRNYISWFLCYVDMFDFIYTDRLHVGICSFLLKKNAYLYDNSYGKVRSVYEYSIASKNIENIKFIEE